MRERGERKRENLKQALFKLQRWYILAQSKRLSNKKYESNRKLELDGWRTGWIKKISFWLQATAVLSSTSRYGHTGNLIRGLSNWVNHLTYRDHSEIAAPPISW